ncbi:RTA1 like protein-domain-containing protein [Mycena belliarum]|uniref:RTA1 like protein-domain-containing protein n=1 Tax=Mycena belliarum TaxID=1033014 RepID=A0AAD6UHU0_9AGAR|nr:RTA1 like protein-domain-containing protein [Mycena belliae]
MADDKSDEPLGGFVPKRLPAYVGLALYALSALIQWTLYFKHGLPRFMLVLTVGMTTMAMGFAFRLVLASNTHSISLDIIMNLFIVLSPCAFLAFDHMLLARLTAIFDDDVAERCLLVRRARITRLFIWTDVLTFQLQGNGAGMAISSTPIAASIGKWMTIVGLVLQFLSFAFFTFVTLLFGYRLRRGFPALWAPLQDHRCFTLFSTHPVNDWRILYWTLCLTCVSILLRSLFRVAEYAGGPTGYLSTHEGYFYLLDALPLWVAMSSFCAVWPTRFLHLNGRSKSELAEVGFLHM